MLGAVGWIVLWLLTTLHYAFVSRVQVSSHAVRDIEEYRNFCDRPKNQRPQPDEVLQVKVLLASILAFVILDFFSIMI